MPKSSKLSCAAQTRSAIPEGTHGTRGNNELTILGACQAGRTFDKQYRLTGSPVWPSTVGPPTLGSQSTPFSSDLGFRGNCLRQSVPNSFVSNNRLNRFLSMEAICRCSAGKTGVGGHPLPSQGRCQSGVSLAPQPV